MFLFAKSKCKFLFNNFNFFKIIFKIKINFKNSNNFLPNNNSTNKKLQFVTLFTMKIEQLIASILRCDLNRVYKILKQLENGNLYIFFKKK